MCLFFFFFCVLVPLCPAALSSLDDSDDCNKLLDSSTMALHGNELYCKQALSSLLSLS